MPNKDLLHVSIARSLYLSMRFGGKIIVLRGTRIRLDRGARIRVPRGCRLVIGKHHAGGAPASLDLRRNGRLTIAGSGPVVVARGTRILILNDAHLAIGTQTTINFNCTITCFKYISIGVDSALGWNSNVCDGNAHEFTVDGVPRPRHKPVEIGDHVWVGTGVTVLGAAIGDGAVIGAGSVVVSAVPGKTLAAGNPARVIEKNVSFKWLQRGATVIGNIAIKPDVMVNVGCGISPTPGWLNFDNSLSVRIAHLPVISSALARLGFLGGRSAELAAMAQHGNVRFANASARIPCAPGSVAALYSSHMIEHLDRAEARSFLTEARRVLQPGGVVRIAAPDLSRLVGDYNATGDADGFVSGIHMGLDRPAGLRARARWTLVGPRHHLWMYDGESLTRLLSEAGFEDAAVLPPGTTRIAEPGQLDLKERAAESVYVEAFRPR